MPQAKTEGVLQIDKIRMRFALSRLVCVLPLSVICFANASSPKGRAKKSVQTFFALTHNPNSSLPLGEMSRSDREG